MQLCKENKWNNIKLSYSGKVQPSNPYGIDPLELEIDQWAYTTRLERSSRSSHDFDVDDRMMMTMMMSACRLIFFWLMEKKAAHEVHLEFLLVHAKR